HTLRDRTSSGSNWVWEGLDFSSEMLRKASHSGIFSRTYLIDLFSADEIPGGYDLVFSRGVLLSRSPAEAIPSTLRKIVASLQPGGLFVFDCLNSLLDDPLAAVSKTRIPFSTMRALMRESGLTVARVEGLAFRTYNVCAIKHA
ncbi:MAG: hypothetical protein ACRDGA_00680, partial [Bacteroidota bacterium]